MILASSDHRLSSVGHQDAARSCEPAADGSAVWNQAILGNLCTMLGRPAVMAIVQRFRAELASRLNEAGVTEATRKDAHIITSQAGMLGFTGLSQAAKGFEAAYYSQVDAALCLSGLLQAKAAVISCIDQAI